MLQDMERYQLVTIQRLNKRIGFATWENMYVQFTYLRWTEIYQEIGNQLGILFSKTELLNCLTK